MAKKAKLDILDVGIDESIQATLQDDVASEKDDGQGSDDKGTGGGLSSKINAWVRRPLFWITLISVILLGAITAVFVWYHYGEDIHTPVVSKEQSLPGGGNPAKDKMVLLEGFVVDQKDEKGNIRIAFCDIALELEKIQTAGALGDRADVRNVVYAALQRKKAEEGLSLEGRNRLKAELKSELNGLLGENMIHSVYFTRYELN